MSQRVDHITIVGGGTAGWLTAVFLVTALNSQPTGKHVKVTVIESPNTPSIGVGESTLPIMPRLLQTLAVPEGEFLRRCNATFKCAGRFVNWDVDGAGRPVTFITPFESVPSVAGYHPAYYFHRFGSPNGRGRLADTVLPHRALIEECMGPRLPQMGDYEFAVGNIPSGQIGVGYAYHIDAGLFAELLRETAIQRGVEHILDDVDDVEQAENGFISALTLRQRGRYPIELVIDCTGFKGVLIRQTLGEPFVPYDEYLLCDRAIPVQIAHDDPRRLMPATTARGMSAGWMWNVPLYNRVGTGYVYSSRFLDDDAALDELLGQIEGREKLIEPKVLKLRFGVTRRAWVKNCIATGLAGGFVEPLEATAIGMIEKQARWLAAYLPDKQMSEPLVRQYNRLVSQVQEEVREFIYMHYYMSNRLDTPFWEAVRYDAKMPDSLREKLELWRHTLPTEDVTAHHQMFDWENYLYVLSAKGYFDGIDTPISPSLSEKPWREYCAQIDQLRHEFTKHLPNHYDLLTHIRGQAG